MRRQLFVSPNTCDVGGGESCQVLQSLGHGLLISIARLINDIEDGHAALEKREGLTSAFDSANSSLSQAGANTAPANAAAAEK